MQNKFLKYLYILQILPYIQYLIPINVEHFWLISNFLNLIHGNKERLLQIYFLLQRSWIKYLVILLSNHIGPNSWKLSKPPQSYRYDIDTRHMATLPFPKELNFTFQEVRHLPISPFLYAWPLMIYYLLTSNMPPWRKHGVYFSWNGKHTTGVLVYSALYPFACTRLSNLPDNCYSQMIQSLSCNLEIKGRALLTLSNFPFCFSILLLL